MNLRIPLVIHGLFNVFFLLLETFCRGFYKFVSLLTLMIKSSDDKTGKIGLLCYFRKNYVGLPISRIKHDDQTM